MEVRPFILWFFDARMCKRESSVTISLNKRISETPLPKPRNRRSGKLDTPCDSVISVEPGQLPSGSLGTS
ncbi:hypothetical protein V3C99_011238 [Haemonchus contortus]